MKVCVLCVYVRFEISFNTHIQVGKQIEQYVNITRVTWESKAH